MAIYNKFKRGNEMRRYTKPFTKQYSQLTPKVQINELDVIMHLKKHGPDTVNGIAVSLNSWYIDAYYIVRGKPDLFINIDPGAAQPRYKLA